MVFPRLMKVIFINGCYWHLHKCPRCRIPSSKRKYWVAKLQRNAKRDKENQRKLRRKGWRVMVVWECQIAAKRLPQLKAKIIGFLESPAIV
jgi:DNA mismatch endonuclease (patch repair protein)